MHCRLVLIWVEFVLNSVNMISKKISLCIRKLLTCRAMLTVFGKGSQTLWTERTEITSILMLSFSLIRQRKILFKHWSCEITWENRKHETWDFIKPTNYEPQRPRTHKINKSKSSFFPHVFVCKCNLPDVEFDCQLCQFCLLVKMTFHLRLGIRFNWRCTPNFRAQI